MVYLYDVNEIGSSRSFDFHVMDNDLYITILDTTAVRMDAMRCFRFKSYEHVVKSCPFPSEYQKEANKRSKRQKVLRSGSIMEMKDVITINLENAPS